MAVDAHHDLAIQIHDHAKHAVRSRMLRAKIQRELAFVLDGSVDRISHYSGASSETAFSSPGISLVMPSQGERKSKFLYSCVSWTGS